MLHVWLVRIIETVAFVSLVALAWYKYLTHHHSKWKRLGVPHAEPTVLFGTAADSICGRAHVTELLHALYRRFRGRPCFGWYDGRQPALVPCDPRLVHAVMVKHHGSFADRTSDNVSFVHDKLHNHLFNMRGDRWKSIRAKLTPIFTAAKLKSMLVDIDDCESRLVDNLNGQIQPGNDFHRVGRDIFRPTCRSKIAGYIRLLGLGRLLDVFQIRDKPDHIYDFLLETTFELHKSGENTRNNFIALLIKLINEEKDHEQKLFTDDILAANIFVFFVAGFEITASTMRYCWYELAINPEIQVKLREKIMQTLNENDGKLSYDVLRDMKYIDMVINETLRMNPPVFNLKRICTKKYTIPDSNITLNVDEKLIIPTYSLHHDPKYYPNPEVFDPERFTEENKSSRPHSTFLPSGDGPKICIGMRFAMMEVKTGLAEILSKFEVSPCKDTQIPIKTKVRSVLLIPSKPIRLLLKKI